MDLVESRICIVGATGGLGSEIARQCVGHGARVVLAGRNPTALERISQELACPSVRIDVAEPTSADQAIAEAVEILGGLDVVICATGTVAFGPVTELEDVILERLFVANVLGPVRVTRAAIGALTSGGVIVNISGIVADHPTAGMAAYSATKAALTAFDRAVAREVRRAGVRILDVRPPHTETGLATRPIAGVAPALPEGRVPREVARAIVDAVAAGATDVVF